MSEPKKTVSLAVELTAAEAWNLAQFLKRAGFAEFRACAQDNDEAHAMLGAAERVRKALAEAGYEPR